MLPTTALTSSLSANMCLPADGPPPNPTCPMYPMCPIRTAMSQEFTALQQVRSGGLQPLESIRTCDWFTNRFEQMQKNYFAYHAALDGLTYPHDVEALMEPEVEDGVLKHLISMSSDVEVAEALRRLVHDINHRPCWQSAEDVSERHFGRTLLRDIQRWVAHNEKVYDDHRKHENRKQFAACLVAVAIVARQRIGAAFNVFADALRAFTMAGVGRGPRNALARDNQDVQRPPGGN